MPSLSPEFQQVRPLLVRVCLPACVRACMRVCLNEVTHSVLSFAHVIVGDSEIHSIRASIFVFGHFFGTATKLRKADAQHRPVSLPITKY